MPERKFSTQKLFRRFSQITGIPLEELYPSVELNASLFPMYFPKNHSMHGGLTSLQTEHEQRHGLQHLIMAQRLSKMTKGIKDDAKGIIKAKKYLAAQRKWTEATNADPRWNRFKDAFGNMGLVKASALGLSATTAAIEIGSGFPVLRLGLMAWLLPQYAAQVLRQTYVRQLYAKHGEDGLLLLWVAPPRNWTHYRFPVGKSKWWKMVSCRPTAGFPKEGFDSGGSNCSRNGFGSILPKRKRNEKTVTQFCPSEGEIAERPRTGSESDGVS